MPIPQVPMQLVTSNDATSADLHIMGNITRGHWLFGKNDSDTDAEDIVQALADLPATVGEITVHINSFGGEVAEGIAIYNALRAHRANVTTVCEGFACSIASVVFMAGNRRVMRPASMLMLHNASMGASGDANALHKAAQDLETITELSKTAYLANATDALTPEKLTQIMDAETWVKPETAVEWGLATEIDEPEQSDEPSQSAAASIMERLTTPTREVVANVTITREQMAEIAGCVIANLQQQQQQTQPQQVVTEVAEPVTTPEPTTPDTASASERIAQLFDKLSNR